MGKEKDIKVSDLVNGVKTFKEPQSAVEFVSKRLGEESPIKWLSKNIVKIFLTGFKNGTVKLIKDPAEAIKNAKNKSGEDKTGIDYDAIEIDDSTLSFKSILGDKTAKTEFNDLLKTFQEETKDIKDEIKEKENDIKNDAKNRTAEKIKFLKIGRMETEFKNEK